jgi:ABC-2 type transport system ATP-binding protein
MNIIEVAHVTKRYSGHVALDNVSLSFPSGSVFGLLGPNGAGKTSLIRLITRITGPDEGKILFKGEPLESHHLIRMGYLPEERGLYRKMEVGEQALYLARLKGLSRQDAMKRLKEWFEKFGIQSWWNRKVEELSKGMAQKVQFITTVLHDPEFVILDEPFTGFDPINAELVKNELLALRKNGTTIVLSTHRMESVEELCSHIALINRSKVILEGSVKDIRHRFRTHAYKVRFSGEPSAFVAALGASGELAGMIPEDDVLVATVRLSSSTTTNDFLKAVMPSAAILGLEEIVPDMNDIFIRQVNADPMTTSTVNA